MLVEGQSADVFGLAPCPAYDRENKPTDLGSVYASGCEDGQVYLWDAADKKSIKAFEIRRAGAEHRPRGCNAGEQLRVKAVAFWLASGDDGLFAVSTAHGELRECETTHRTPGWERGHRRRGAARHAERSESRRW